MAEESNVQRKPVGIFGKLLNAFFGIVGVLILSAIFSVLLEWIGMAYFYENSSYKHAEGMMKKELTYLTGSTSDGANDNAVLYMVGLIADIKDIVLVNSGILGAINESTIIKPTDGDIVVAVKQFASSYYDYLLAAVFVLIMFLIRLSILILSLPVFILFAIVGLCDGLMQRDLRRWGGGNESGFQYHWAKKFVIPVFVLSWVLYLSIPESIHPNYIITPFAVLFGVTVMIMASKFKKYL